MPETADVIVAAYVEPESRSAAGFSLSPFERKCEKMKVRYKIIVELDTDDYIRGLEDINDAIQDHVGWNPKIEHISIFFPRRLQGSVRE